MAQWGFLLEFNLSGFGEGRGGGGRGEGGEAGNGLGQQQYGICVD